MSTYPEAFEPYVQKGWRVTALPPATYDTFGDPNFNYAAMHSLRNGPGLQRLIMLSVLTEVIHEPQYAELPSAVGRLVQSSWYATENRLYDQASKFSDIEALRAAGRVRPHTLLGADMPTPAEVQDWMSMGPGVHNDAGRPEFRMPDIGRSARPGVNREYIGFIDVDAGNNTLNVGMMGPAQLAVKQLTPRLA